jgi:hypothetical protein
MSDAAPETVVSMKMTGDDLLAGDTTELSGPVSPVDQELVVVTTWTTDRLATDFADLNLPQIGTPAQWSVADFGPRVSMRLHQTPTVDVDHVIAGRIELGLEVGSVTLEAGDSVVIPGLMHFWRTHEEGCSVLFSSLPLVTPPS